MTRRIDWLLVGATILCILVAVTILMLNPAIGRELVVASTYGDSRDYTPNKHLRQLRSVVATGAAFDSNGMTAAHRTLPFNTWVTLKHGHRVVDVKIVDRGPFIRGREFDLTPAVNKFLQCGGLCRVERKPYPPLPKPKPNVEIALF